MSSSAPNLFVSVADSVVLVQIRGRASFTISADFKILIHGLVQKGYRRFILDLSECLVMDSTFLGVLAGVGLKLAGSAKNNGSSSIELFRPNPRVSELLDNLGVAHLFKFVNGAQSLPGKVESLRPVVPEASREELTRTCLEAHLTLMDINPDNVPKFKEVAKFLAEDLEKLQAQKT
ncbi:MAG: STAS domain-containing protein [Verrucomicrobiota bacterium]